MINSETVWHLVVDVAPPDGQLAFVTDIVTRLATAFKETGSLPDPLMIRINHGAIAGPELAIHPVGAIGDNLIVLDDALSDPGHLPEFHTAPANVVNVQAEDLAAGNDVPRRLGLYLSYDGLPVLMIHGEAGRLLLTMDGFERSVIGMTEAIPGLWERVRRATGSAIDKAQAAVRGRSRSPEGQRRQSGARRDDALAMRRERSGPIGQLGLSLPAITIRPIPIHGGVGPTTGEDLMLVPIQGQKGSSGDYPPREALAMLRTGLGVQTVLADYRLRALLRDRDRPQDELTKVLPMSIGHLRDIGSTHLADWTEFDTAQQVRDWADADQAAHPALRNVGRALIEAELVSVKILSQALLHAERVVDAHDQGERQPPEAAAGSIVQAYKDSRGDGMALALGDLVQVAALGNVHPAILWQLPHDEVGLPFEVARVMGRVLAGARATLPPHLQAAVREALDIGAVRNDPAEPAIAVAVRALVREAAELVGPERLLQSLTRAEDTGGLLVIERRTRRIRVLPT